MDTLQHKQIAAHIARMLSNSTLMAQAAELRAMKLALRARPANFASFDNAERAAQAAKDEKQVRAYKKAVRAYRRNVERIGRAGLQA